MSSEAKIASNRQNARRSTGPKTQQGKQRVGRNALKHGLFAKELLISDEETPTFESLRTAIWIDLNPSTILQQTAVEEVVCCHWRCKLAVRMEMRALKACTGLQQEQESTPTPASIDPVMARWYAAGRQELRDGLRFLKRVREGVAVLGRVPEDLLEGIVKGFGPQFLEALTKWTPISYDALLIANFTAAKSKRLEEPVLLDGKRPPDVVLDPQQGREMTFKLIDLQMQHLHDLSAVWDNLRGQGTKSINSFEFAPRYFTTATRDLHRAVQWFQYLKENGL